MQDHRVYILEDDREKKPWSAYWKPEDVVVIERRLVTGDYALSGLEDFGVCVERKSLGDLVQSCIQDWLRHRKKLYRMSAFDAAIIVVEASIGQILRHEYESDANPNSVMGRVHSMTLDHGIPVCFWDNAETAARETLHWLRLAQKKYSHHRG